MEYVGLIIFLVLALGLPLLFTGDKGEAREAVYINKNGVVKKRAKHLSRSQRVKRNWDRLG